MMKAVTILDYLFGVLFLGLAISEFGVILQKYISKDTFEAVNFSFYDKMLPPLITICPSLAWKSTNITFRNWNFSESIFTWEEIFHPKTLLSIRNESRFILSRAYTNYYGFCFTLQKLVPETVSDYSFQMVLNNSIGNFFSWTKEQLNKRFQIILATCMNPMKRNTSGWVCTPIK